MSRDLATAEFVGRLERLADLLPGPPPGSHGRVPGTTSAVQETPRVELPWELGMLDWFASTPRVVDCSFFARPLGAFGGGDADDALGGAACTGDQRTLYYLQLMSPLTVTAGDLALLSSSAMRGQEDLLCSWASAGLVSDPVLAQTYVVDDLGRVALVP